MGAQISLTPTNDWDEAGRSILTRLGVEAFSSVDAQLAAAPGDHRFELIETIALHETEKLLRKWQAESQHPWAAVATSLHLHEAAWTRRGYEDQPEPADLEAFQSMVSTADETLRAVERDAPDDLSVIIARMIVARSADVPELVESLWHRGNEIHPDSRRLNHEYLKSLSPRWFGSFERMFEFSTQLPPELRPGDFRILLPLRAHLEVILVGIAEKGAATDVMGLVSDYLMQYHVRLDLLYAANQYLGADPEEWSSRHPEDLNLLAFLLTLASEPVADLFVALEGRVTDYPWRHFGIPVETFDVFQSAGLRTKKLGHPRKIYDKRAGEIFVGNISAVAGILLGLALLVFTIPQDIAYARIDRDKPVLMRLDSVERVKRDNFLGSIDHVASGTIVDSHGETFARAIVPREMKDHPPAEITVYAMPGKDEYVSDADLRQLRHGIRTPLINFSLLFLLGFGITLFSVFLLFVRIDRPIEKR